MNERLSDRVCRVGGGAESGHLLLTLMVALMVMAVFLGVAFQQWSVVQRRDLEHELIFRGNQYVNAIIAYRAEHGGALPLELDALYRPGPRGLRYIRKLYPDPFDRKGEGWGLLYLGPGGRWVYDPQAAARVGSRAGLPTQGVPASGIGGMSEISAGFHGIGTQAHQAGSTGRGGFPAEIADSSGEPDPGAAFDPGAWTGQGQGDVRGPDGAPLRQIVGVVSRSGEEAYYRYSQRDHYWDWQFHIFAVIREAKLGVRESRPSHGPGGMGPGGTYYPPGQEPKGVGRKPAGSKN